MVRLKPDTTSAGFRIGINIGKNKDTPNERAADDYVRTIDVLHPFADYFAINVSSPNTEGLRDLQDSRTLRALVEQVVARVGERSRGRAIPVLVKMSPDAADNDLLQSVDAAVEGGAAGVIATNTTVARPALENRSAAIAGWRPERRTAEVNRELHVRPALPPSGETSPDRRCRRHLHRGRCVRANPVGGDAHPGLHGAGLRRDRVWFRGCSSGLAAQAVTRRILSNRGGDRHRCARVIPATVFWSRWTSTARTGPWRLPNRCRESPVGSKSAVGSSRWRDRTWCAGSSNPARACSSTSSSMTFRTPSRRPSMPRFEPGPG